MPGLRRCEIIMLLGGAVTASPLAMRAQQPNLPAVGVLVHAAPGWERFWRLFPEALRDIGYTEGFRANHRS